MAKFTPRFPKNATDGQEVADKYGNVWRYYSATGTWVSIGFLQPPIIVDEKNDGFEDETTSNGLPWDEKDVPAAKPKPAFNYNLNTSKAKQSKGDQFDSLFGEDA